LQLVLFGFGHFSQPAHPAIEDGIEGHHGSGGLGRRGIGRGFLAFVLHDNEHCGRGVLGREVQGAGLKEGPLARQVVGIGLTDVFASMVGKIQVVLAEAVGPPVVARG
jgi:hypothetical protein